ncbi:hypothetical protein LR69_03448 [Geobacillus sp. BCO2]|nr:hypothetical protein LR69_03448 [Geobacillus sp. BCO2]
MKGENMMMANIIIGGAIFAYAGWTLVRHVKKKRQRGVRVMPCSGPLPRQLRDGEIIRSRQTDS